MGREDLVRPREPGEANPARKMKKMKCSRVGSRCQADLVTVILAGGKGTRLQPLTDQRCKPAVSFGGSLRVIDFTLFNCVLSGIHSIHVLTQYRSETLHAYLRYRWQPILRAGRGDLHLLPARECEPARNYRGTADAVYQNRRLLEELRPAHVLVLSGDHVYRADYRRMLEVHLESRADVTLLADTVPSAEASSFGVLRTGEGGRVRRFIEKPEDPSPYATGGNCSINLGIYLFRGEVLREALENDARAESAHDFGKDILPALLDRASVVACPLADVTPDTHPYWRDVGTVQSLFDAHMDLLDPDGFRLEDPRWLLGCPFASWLPRRYPLRSSDGNGGAVGCSLVSSDARLEGAEIHRCVIGRGARIARDARLCECVVLPGAVVGEGACLRGVIVEEGGMVPAGADFGPTDPDLGAPPRRAPRRKERRKPLHVVA